MEVLDERKKNENIASDTDVDKGGGASGVIAKIKNHRFYKRLKGIKNIELIATVFVIALVLLIYAGVKNGEASKTDPNNDAGTNVSSTMNTDELRLAATLEKIDGAGAVTAMITTDDTGNSVSAVIVAEGAKDMRVKLKLLEAVQTILQLPASKVEIYQSK